MDARASALFSGVPAGPQVDRSAGAGYPFAEDTLGAYITAKPVGTVRSLTLVWQLPSEVSL